MDVLVGSSWPGNVRQLRNVVERLVVTVSDDMIRGAHLPADLSPTVSPTSSTGTLAEATEAAEKTAIQSALAANDFHREKTATSLGISVRTLHYKMNRYGLH